MSAEKGYDAPNFTQVPNVFLDKQMPKIKSLAELKVALALMRQTFGWQKKSDVVSLSQLVALTGLSRPSVNEGIKDALRHGIIDRKRAGNSYVYWLVVKILNQSDESSDSVASKESLPEMVKKVNQQVVKNLNPQKKVVKKRKENPTNVGAATANATAADNRKPIEKNPVKYLVDLLKDSKERGLHPPPLPPRQRSEYGQFIKQAFLDGEPSELCENAVCWLVAKASGEINDEKKAWAFFGTALDHAREGWRPKAKLALVSDEHWAQVAENERTLQELLKGTAYG